jgi:23S rRNA (guanosine2251-2'-O)-methyltransferase
MSSFRKLGMDELERLSAEDARQKAVLPVVFVLDNIRSLSNVGSVFRTADSLGLKAIYLCGFTGQPPNREMEKTALGATDSVQWKHFPDVMDCLAYLKNQGYLIAALEQTTESTPLHTFRCDEPLALVLGNEIHGVSEEALAKADLVLEIPQFGMKHSLNVSVSAGIVAWHLLSAALKEKF